VAISQENPATTTRNTAAPIEAKPAAMMPANKRAATSGPTSDRRTPPSWHAVGVADQLSTPRAAFGHRIKTVKIMVPWVAARTTGYIA